MINNNFVGAYVLASDAEELARTLPRYYDHINSLIVSFDANNLSWSGKKLDVIESLKVIQNIDLKNKAIYFSGNYSSTERARGENELLQRQDALYETSKYCKWVLQIDSDEFVPDVKKIFDLIAIAERLECSGIEWPMKVIFRQTRRYSYQIINKDDSLHVEYPGPIMVKANSNLILSRQISKKSLRIIPSSSTSLQVVGSASEHNIQTYELEDGSQFLILHNSWGKKPKDIISKIRNSPHFGTRLDLPYFFLWLFSPVFYRFIRNFNPVTPPLWAKLRKERI